MNFTAAVEVNGIDSTKPYALIARDSNSTMTWMMVVEVKELLLACGLFAECAQKKMYSVFPHSRYSANVTLVSHWGMNLGEIRLYPKISNRSHSTRNKGCMYNEQGRVGRQP